ncbi:MAG: nitroreductase [Pseudomonadota bacterium]
MSTRPDFSDVLGDLGPVTRAVSQAILTRRSVRGFRDTPVEKTTIETILRTAARSPSGSNIQPWHVTVVAGDVRDDIVAAVCQAAETEPETHTAQYDYYPTQWRSPYIDRRRATGWGLYGTLGIEKGDKVRMRAQHMRNYEFFGAPVGLFFTMDADMEKGSWLDIGTFIQSVMIAARGHGLDTCPQQAWSQYWRILFPKLGISDDKVLVCGMALGFIDNAEPANAFWTEREPLDGFASFSGFQSQSPPNGHAG